VRPTTDPAHFGPPMHQQILYPSHFPGSVGGPNAGNSLPPTPSYNVRSGMMEKSIHTDMKSLTGDVNNPAVIGLDPRIIQSLPQHAVLHANDHRNTESPMLTPMYGVQRSVYQPQPPTHPPLSRQTFKNPYAELVEREMQNSQSPSYTTSFDNRTITTYSVAAAAASDRESLRVKSPYNTPTAGLSKRMYSPPPAHIRYDTHPLPAADPSGPNDRLRQLHVQTPPHASQAPPQGDSLLMLLQVCLLKFNDLKNKTQQKFTVSF